MTVFDYYSSRITMSSFIKGVDSMGKFIDLTGQTFNDVYIESRAENAARYTVQWNCICLRCGKRFVARGGNIKSGSTKSCGCTRAEANHKRCFDDLTGQIFGSLYIESFFGTDKHMRNHWNARCLLCGKITHPETTTLKRGKSKTCGCQRMANLKKSREVDITDRVFDMLTAKYRVGVDKHRKVLWYCECACGGWCIEPASMLLQGKVSSCGCIKSKNERRIALWLDDHHIGYERQRTFDDCKNINPLRFDFYISTKKTVIEYDGEFHYMKIGNLNNDLEYQQNNDHIKDQYCAENNIRILRIPYWEKDNIESILSEWFPIDDADEANSSDVDLSA